MMNNKELTQFQIANNLISSWLDGDKRKRGFLFLKWVLDTCEIDRIFIFKRFLEKYHIQHDTKYRIINELKGNNLIISNSGKDIYTQTFISAILKRKDEINEYFNKYFNINLLSPIERYKHIKQSVVTSPMERLEEIKND